MTANQHKPNRWVQGFTLLELLITGCIIAILAASAAPSFDKYLERKKGMLVRDAIFLAFREAKNDALINHKRVIICGSSDGVHCDYGWNHSLIVFRDLKMMQFLTREIR